MLKDSACKTKDPKFKLQTPNSKTQIQNSFFDPGAFKRHVMGGWGPFLEASNGKLPLELTFHNQDHTMIMTAVLVQRIQIPEEAYDIDKLIERSNN